MIKYFDSQYAGSVDLPDDDVGFEATPVNDRWLSDESLAYPLHKFEGMAKTMDRLGYDTLWFAERHFQREGYECLPNLLLLATHLAQVTEAIMEIQKKYPGLERLYVSCTLFGCSLELTLDQLQRFAEEVMPNFKHTPAS